MRRIRADGAGLLALERPARTTAARTSRPRARALAVRVTVRTRVVSRAREAMRH